MVAWQHRCIIFPENIYLFIFVCNLTDNWLFRLIEIFPSFFFFQFPYSSHSSFLFSLDGENSVGDTYFLRTEPRSVGHQSLSQLD